MLKVLALCWGHDKPIPNPHEFWNKHLYISLHSGTCGDTSMKQNYSLNSPPLRTLCLVWRQPSVWGHVPVTKLQSGQPTSGHSVLGVVTAQCIGVCICNKTTVRAAYLWALCARHGDSPVYGGMYLNKTTVRAAYLWALCARHGDSPVYGGMYLNKTTVWAAYLEALCARCGDSPVYGGVPVKKLQSWQPTSRHSVLGMVTAQCMGAHPYNKTTVPAAYL